MRKICQCRILRVMLKPVGMYSSGALPMSRTDRKIQPLLERTPISGFEIRDCIRG